MIKVNEMGIQARHRIGELEVADILPLIHRESTTHMMFEGNKIKLNSLRLRTFKHKGCVCVRCGIIGTKFIVERDMWYGRGANRRVNTNAYHINLYGYTETGQERLLTKDHILARANRGRDELDNMQTMCDRCNRKKGADYDWEVVVLNWRDALPPYKVPYDLITCKS